MNRQHGGVRSGHPPGLIDFSSNLNPWGPPESVLRLFEQDLSREIAAYPDPDYPALRASLEHYTGCPPERIFPANGSEEIFFWICRLRAPREVLVINPTYGEYAIASRAVGAEVRELVLKAGNDFALCPEEAAAPVCRADLVFLCNPNNPTGNLVSREAIRDLAGKMKPGAVMVVDEAFMDFVKDGGSSTAVPLVGEGLWVTRSLTKFFSLAGLRLGYLLAPAETIRDLEKITPLWRVNRPAELAAIAALDDVGYIEDIPGRMARERDRFAEELRATGWLRPYPSTANYLLVELTTPGMTAVRLQRDLLGRGFLIREASGFPGLNERFFRLAVLDRDNNAALVREMERMKND
jgi:threonine-phosphate decarboxylase